MSTDGLGLMLTPMIGNKPDLSQFTWAADTGCFAQPKRHDDDKYIAWLEARQPFQGRCLFATAPDVVGDAEATLTRSLPVLPRIRNAGYKAALVAQNGIEKTNIPWDDFDALFIGGDTAWKLSEPTYELVREASERGKWTHMGRVNSLKRIKAALVSGYDSADGTYIRFGPDILTPRVLGWARNIIEQPTLFQKGKAK
jgi:hypothetical protein